MGRESSCRGGGRDAGVCAAGSFGRACIRKCRSSLAIAAMQIYGCEVCWKLSSNVSHRIENVHFRSPHIGRENFGLKIPAMKLLWVLCEIVHAEVMAVWQ